MRSGVLWIIVSVFGGISLAVLGKENGIALSLYVICLEVTIFSGADRSRPIRGLVWPVLLLPVVLFAAYLLYKVGHLRAAFAIRDFTPLERVLTEFIVVGDYLQSILLPRPSAFTLFHDAYPVSRGIWSPPATLLAMAATAAILLVSFLMRKKYPVPVLGVLLFYAGHLPEAGPFSLELYFEHRNYLPAAGILILLAWLLSSGIARYGRPVMVFACLYTALLAMITWDEARLWSTPEVQLVDWLSTNPESERAHQELAMLYRARGEYEEAARIYQKLAERYPNDMYAEVHLLYLGACTLQQPPAEDNLHRIRAKAAAPLRYNLPAVAALDYLVLAVLENRCPGLDPAELEAIITILSKNPDSWMDAGILHEFLASLASYRGDFVTALEYLRSSLALRFEVNRKLREINLLDRLNRTRERENAIMELKQYLAAHPLQALAYNNIYNRL
jgi:tetratricopeptide (TPR) repeat protein